VTGTAAPRADLRDRCDRRSQRGTIVVTITCGVAVAGLQAGADDHSPVRAPEITLVTLEREPLVIFGREASAALASAPSRRMVCG
jgi:hypothetical protein